MSTCVRKVVGRDRKILSYIRKALKDTFVIQLLSWGMISEAEIVELINEFLLAAYKKSENIEFLLKL